MPVSLSAHFSGDDQQISTSATLLYTSSPAASATEPEVIIVQNNTATQVTVGGADVADASNGVVLPASGNTSVSISLKFPGIAVYAAAASGTPTVQVVRL